MPESDGEKRERRRREHWEALDPISAEAQRLKLIELNAKDIDKVWFLVIRLHEREELILAARPTDEDSPIGGTT
jgi:hypothetical protein